MGRQGFESLIFQFRIFSKETGFMQKKVSGRTWIVIILFGLFGQIAWSVENMYFNLFLFNEIGGTTTDISVMVAASAITATAATLLMGALSDRIGYRRMFISVGYIVWGLVTASFAFISRGNVARFAPAASVVATAVTLVIIMDCIMSYIGSTANDAAFNAWVTEFIDTSNRGKVEGVLSVFPLLAMVIVSGVSGILIESIGYPLFFASLGGLVTLAGFLGIFIIPRSATPPVRKESYFSGLIYGFLPGVIRKNKSLYLSLLSMCIFGISFQVMMPYLLIYFEHYLRMDALTYSIVLVAAIFTSSVTGIVLGRLVDRFGRKKFGILSVAVFTAGLIMLYLVRDVPLVGAAGTIMLCGYLLISIVINTSVRDNTPRDKVGLFQGVRMIFFVLIPMTIGPAIGNAVIQRSNITFANEFNEITKIPTPEIFLAAAIVAVLIIIPMNLVLKSEKNRPSDSQKKNARMPETPEI